VYLEKDRANDQIYIGFRSESAGKPGVVKKTVRVGDDILVDLDARGRLLGLDIGNASRVLGREAFQDEFVADELVGVAEAARLCGVRKPNFVRDYASRAEFPEPVVELASGRIWRRSQVQAFLDAPAMKRLPRGERPPGRRAGERYVVGRGTRGAPRRVADRPLS
jgi:uncharacterized protein YuzE